MIDIGSAIRSRRERCGLSQLDLALAVGYKNSSDISRVETGKQWPDAAKLADMAKAFGCSISEIFAEAEGRTSSLNERVQKYHVDAPPRVEAPDRSYLERGDPPSLDDALKDVEFMLTGTDQKELLAAIAFQGMMTRYATDRLCSSINSLVIAVESLRDSLAPR